MKNLNKSINMSKREIISPSTWSSINWTKVKQEVRDYQHMIAKEQSQGNVKEVTGLQNKLVESFAARAWAVKKVLESPGAQTPGVDGIKIVKDRNWDDSVLDKFIQQLSDIDGYKAKPVRRVYIPKSNGKMRPLGIPTLFDRSMQYLWYLALAPIAEQLGDSSSFGFRPGRSQKDALSQLWLNLNITKVRTNRNAKGYYYMPKNGLPRYVLDADIKGFFDNISHDWLIANIPMNKQILSEFLNAGYSDKLGVHTTKSGVPQGGVISPTLANMVLDKMEYLIQESATRNNFKTNIKLVRYADDFVVICPFEDRLLRLKRRIAEFLKERGLELNENKTKVVDLFTDKEGFKFLGCQVHRPKRTLKSYQSKQQKEVLTKTKPELVDKTILIIKPHPKSVVEFRRGIRREIHSIKYTEGFDILVEHINPILRGWYNYYKSVVATNVFSSIDISVHKAIMKWLKKKHSTDSTKFIEKRYSRRVQNRNWFGYSKGDKFERLFVMNAHGIQRHNDVCKNLNFYDKKNLWYFAERMKRIETDSK